MSSGIHWYILSLVSIIMYKNVNDMLALIHSPHLCITYLSFHALLTSLVESPFLVWLVLVKCNAMDKNPFSLLWHFYLFMNSFIFIYLFLLLLLLLLSLLLLFFWIAIFVLILHNFQRHSHHYQVTEPKEKKGHFKFTESQFVNKKRKLCTFREFPT